MYNVQQGAEDINSNGGIALAGALLDRLQNLGKFNRMKMGKTKKGWMAHRKRQQGRSGVRSLRSGVRS